MPEADGTGMANDNDTIASAGKTDPRQKPSSPPRGQLSTKLGNLIPHLAEVRTAYGQLLRITKRLTRQNETLERRQRESEERIVALERELSAARALHQALSLKLFPQDIAARLDADPRAVIAQGLPSATFLLADLFDFDHITANLPPERVIGLINQLFGVFDVMLEDHGAEKVKTMGDSYLCAVGTPRFVEDHARRGAALALDMMETARKLKVEERYPLNLRVVLHSGPVVAGLVGEVRPAWDLVGPETKAVRSLLNMCGSGRILCSQAFKDACEAPLPGQGETVPREEATTKTEFTFEKNDSLADIVIGSGSLWHLAAAAGKN